MSVENTYGGCVDSLYSKIRSYRGTNEAGYYQCQKTTHTWVLVNNNLTIDTQGWSEGDDGYSKWGDSVGVVSDGNRICYVYDTSAAYNGWRSGNTNDCSLELGGCTKGRAGTMLMASNGDYYNCVDNRWNRVTDVILRNTQNWACKDSNAGEMRHGLVDDVYFICDMNAWIQATTQEEKACRVEGVCRLCTESMQGTTEKRDDATYICDRRNWRKFNCAEIKKGACIKNDSTLVEACETVGGFEIDYVCSDNHWHAVTSPFEYTLKDWNKKKEAYYTAEMHPEAEYGEDFTDPRDKNVYKTIIVNGKRVFAENLRYADSTTMVNLKENSWCFKNEAKNCEIGGRYYSWTAAVNLNSQWQKNSTEGLIAEQHQGICPPGWHIPDDTEWDALLSDVGYAKQQMMGFNSWTAATDVSGFSALPVGFYAYRIINVGEETYFWSASEYNYDAGSHWTLYTSSAHLNYGYFDKRYLISVRCIENY
jgi:uncharacterized protein (TIGR02145 family)